MELFYRLLLSPMAFAVGFLWPLATQSLVALGYIDAGVPAIAAGAAVAIPFGIMAQVRGSWVWIK